MKCPTLCSYMLRYVSRDMWLLWIVQIYVANMRFPVLCNCYEVSSNMQLLRPLLWSSYFEVYIVIKRSFEVSCFIWRLCYKYEQKMEYLLLPIVLAFGSLSQTFCIHNDPILEKIKSSLNLIEDCKATQ